MIRAVFFDANDILYYRLEPLNRTVAGLMRARGYTPELSSKDAVLMRELEGRASIGAATPWDYWGERLRLHGVSDPKERRTLIRQILQQVHRIAPMLQAAEALGALKQRGFHLGVVTNTMYPLHWKKRWLRTAGVGRFIDIISCSTVVGAVKPDPKIYLDALAQAHVAPSEAAFVGHDDDELVGARAVGMVTVAVRPDGGADVDYEVRQLTDLLTLLPFQRSQ
ncbi:MAG TPA: HAD family hydrolase [Anaerolineales bacterium]